MNAKVKKYLTVMTLGLAGGSIYFLPYIKYIFMMCRLHLWELQIRNQDYCLPCTRLEI